MPPIGSSTCLCLCDKNPRMTRQRHPATGNAISAPALSYQPGQALFDLDPEGVLRESPTVSAARIEELHAALVIVLRRANEKIGPVAAGFGSVERENAGRRADVALIDLQIAELSSEL